MTVMHQSWIDGKSADCIRVTDRAVQYGDGVFETMRISNAQVEFLPRHLARLAAGSDRLGIRSVPWEMLENEIMECAGQYQQAVLKVVLSRGSSERGYRCNPAAKPTRILGISPIPEWPQERYRSGVRARLCSTRLALQPALAGIKHLNRLEQVLARAEWSDPAIAEGLMCDSNDYLIEGTMSNVFLVDDGALFTPELSGCGVAGIMRSVIIDLARQLGFRVSIKPLTLSDAKAAEELFICNSLIDIWPVCSIDRVTDYAIGPVTRALIGGLGKWDDSGNSNWCDR